MLYFFVTFEYSVQEKTYAECVNEVFDESFVVEVVDEISPDIVELSSFVEVVVTLRSAISCRFIRSSFSM